MATELTKPRIKRGTSPNHEKHREDYRRLGKARAAKGRELINLAKSRPCVDCGGVFDPECMDLDHRDPSRKSFAVSQGMMRSLKTLAMEIEKCDVVCANCHRLRTKRAREAQMSRGPKPVVVRTEQRGLWDRLGDTRSQDERSG